MIQVSVQNHRNHSIVIDLGSSLQGRLDFLLSPSSGGPIAAYRVADLQDCALRSAGRQFQVRMWDECAQLLQSPTLEGG
jgi:hypothetical protein